MKINRTMIFGIFVIVYSIVQYISFPNVKILSESIGMAQPISSLVILLYTVVGRLGTALLLAALGMLAFYKGWKRK